MEEGQRTSILEAVAEAIVEPGMRGVSSGMAEVLARPGVSDAAFHQAFPDPESCLLATFDLGVARARRRMLAAYDVERRWLDAIRAALAALLRFLADEPALGRVLFVYSMSGGERMLQRRAQVTRELAAVVDRGRLEAPAGRRQPPAVVAEGVVGAVLAIIQNRLLADEGPGVLDLFGSLVSIVALPYLGAGVARRELTRPMPVPWSVPGQGSVVAGTLPESSVGASLTYRTARVLGVIADNPGASNREVADRAGVSDQGQISKLLGRLADRRLIEKIGEGSTRGAPNSWRLTDSGERLLKDQALLSRS